MNFFKLYTFFNKIFHFEFKNVQILLILYEKVGFLKIFFKEYLYKLDFN